MLHALLSWAADGGKWLASKAATSIQVENIFNTIQVLWILTCHWWVIPDIKKNTVFVTFNDNQSMNKISYLGLEGNPNSLVAKLTA